MNDKKKSNKAVVTGVALVMMALLTLVIGSGLAWAEGPVPGGSFGPFGGLMGGYGCGGYGAPASNNVAPISLDQAVQSVQNFLAAQGNSDLVATEVEEFEANFYAPVKEKSTGKYAFELLVNKYTGAVYPEMGPNMMWNTKYGMMSGMMGGYYRGLPGEDMPVSPDQAKTNARNFLDRYSPGTTTEDDSDIFYGYYTMDTLVNGKKTGMISVNGYSGSVWYHSWHGPFVQMKDLE